MYFALTPRSVKTNQFCGGVNQEKYKQMIIINCHQLSSAVINYHQLSSAVINCHQLSSTVKKLSSTVIDCHDIFLTNSNCGHAKRALVGCRTTCARACSYVCCAPARSGGDVLCAVHCTVGELRIKRGLWCPFFTSGKKGKNPHNLAPLCENS